MGIPDLSINRHNPSRSASASTTALERAGRVDVDTNHGLWHFFRKREVDGEVMYDTVEAPDVTSHVTGAFA